jgi:hypothetical protein
MKKIFAISFLLFANLVFWAHAVIPHHHHGNVTCFEVSHCCNDADHNHEADHNHDHSDTSLCRILQDVVPTESSDQKFKVEVNDFHSLFLAVIPELISLDNHEVDIVLLLRSDFSQSLYESLIVSGQGLRAPPAC